MTGLGIIYSGYNHLIEEVYNAMQVVHEREDRLNQHPSSTEAKKDLAISKVVLDDIMTSAKSRFEDAVIDGISTMQQRNKSRHVDEPSNAQINILSALQMIKHPSDELLSFVFNALKGCPMAVMALDCIVQLSWADVPDHVCKTYSDQVSMPLSVVEVEDQIAKLKRFCDKILKEDAEALEKRKPFTSTNELVSVATGADPDRFIEAVGLF